MIARDSRAWRLRSMVAALAFSLTLAGCGGSVSSPSGSALSSGTPATATGGSSGGSSTGALNGSYPAPQDQTFQGCPPQGDGGDSLLNLRKNRTDSGDWQPATVSSIVGLPYPSSVVKQPRSTWSSADAQSVAQSEGRPLQITGYLLLVRHEGPESPNCHDPNQRDFHMWLAEAPGALSDRAQSMIVEVAPRARALNRGWQPDGRLLGLRGHHVRISGWLMLDQEHPEQVGKTRGTLWEIHPVMKIEVEQNGTWLDLNDSSLQISAPAGGTQYSGGSTTSSGTRHIRHHRHRAKTSSESSG